MAIPKLVAILTVFNSVMLGGIGVYLVSDSPVLNPHPAPVTGGGPVLIGEFKQTIPTVQAETKPTTR